MPLLRFIIVKKLSSLRLLRTTSATRRSKTANITKGDITLQHHRHNVTVLLLRFFTIIFAVFLHDLAYAYQISFERNHSKFHKQVT